MLDFDLSKMFVVAIIAIMVIPPKDLPRVMRTVGQVMGRMRRMAAEFQGQFMDAMREAEFESVRKELADLNQKATSASFDPAVMIRDEVTKAAEPIAHMATPTGPAEIGSSQIELSPPAEEAKPVEGAASDAPATKSSAAE